MLYHRSKLKSEMGRNRNLLRAVAFLAVALPVASYAQSSVTLYGIVDSGLQFVNHSGSSGGSTLGVESGGFWPSRFGLRGQEDLGAGLKALFRLENGFNIGTGALSASNTLWSRMSYVGLNSDLYGTLTAGRQFSVQWDKTLWYDPTTYAGYSIMSLLTMPRSTLVNSNSIKYQSPTISGLNVEAMYGFGQEMAGNPVAGRYIGASLEYVNGPFATRFLYEEARGQASTVDQSGLADRRYSLAARWVIPERYNLAAGVTRIGGQLQLTPRGTIYWITGGYWPSPSTTINLELGRYDYQGTGHHSQLASLEDRHFLSKSTFLYAQVGYMANQGTADLGVLDFTTTTPGKNQLAASFGINKRF